MNVIPPFHVDMDLGDLLYLSYLVPEERLRSRVPRSLPFAFARDGMTVVSIVTFHCRNVKVSFLPLIRFAYDQVNLRTYVIDPLSGRTAVLFLASGISSRFVSAATNSLSVPWQFVRARVKAEYDDSGFSRYEVDGGWSGEFRISIAAASNQGQRGFFPTSQEAARSIITPGLGLFPIRAGLARIEVSHPETPPLFGSVESMEFPLPERLGLLKNEELTEPFSAMVVKAAHFTISMPPRILKL